MTVSPAAGGQRQAIRRSPVASVEIGLAVSPGIGLAEGRGDDDAEHRPAVLDERDIDREFAVAAEELLGSVQRIDEPEARADAGRPDALGGLLLRDHRNPRGQRAERRQDDGFRRLIGERHRAAVGLFPHAGPVTVEGEGGAPGFLGQRPDGGEKIAEGQGRRAASRHAEAPRSRPRCSSASMMRSAACSGVSAAVSSRISGFSGAS